MAILAGHCQLQPHNSWLTLLVSVLHIKVEARQLVEVVPRRVDVMDLTIGGQGGGARLFETHLGGRRIP